MGGEGDDPRVEEVEEKRTCWHRYERLRALLMRAAHIRWRPCVRREGIRPRWLAFGLDQRCEFWGRGHRG